MPRMGPVKTRTCYILPMILDRFRVTDQVAIVTGAGGGLGRQHALALAARLNPDNEAGRLTFITRFGAEKVGGDGVSRTDGRREDEGQGHDEEGTRAHEPRRGRRRFGWNSGRWYDSARARAGPHALTPA